MTDPLLELLTDVAGLMHPAFTDAANPASVKCEFYHQFRKLWDRGIPVGMGLGHLLVKHLDDQTLGIVRLGEGGRPNENLAAVRFVGRAPVAGFARTLAVTCAPKPRVEDVTPGPSQS
jgi:hypothetical protein